MPRGSGGKLEMYRSPVAPLLWWVWVAFAAANLIDLAVQGRNHFAAMVAVILVLITGVVYAAAFRPRVLVDNDGMTIINPLRDFEVPWNCVERVTLGDSLEVYCNWQEGPVKSPAAANGASASSNGASSNGVSANGAAANGVSANGARPGGGTVQAGNRSKKLYGWAVHSPRRTRLKTEMRALRQSRQAERELKSYGRLPREAKEAMTKTDVEHIVRALEGRADKARTTAIADRGPVGRWDWLAITALVIPALLVIVVGLL